MSLSEALTKEIEPTEKAFEATINTLVAAIDFVDVAEKLRPRIGKVLQWDAVGGELREYVQRYLNLKDSYSKQVCGSVLVLGYGAFEQFLRRFVEVAVSTLGREISSIEDLPPEFLEENIHRTGRALWLVKSKTEFSTHDHLALARNLGSCTPGQSDFALNSEVFGSDIGALTKENIESLFRRLGVKLNWDDVARRRDVKDVVEENDVRRCSKLVESRLRQIVSTRNSLAHTGVSSAEITEESIRSNLEFMRILSGAITTVMIRSIDRKYS